MATYTPDGFVALLAQPLVSKHLGIVIMYFKRAMVYVASLVSAHEERVVVNIIVTAVNMGEDSNVLPGPIRLIDVQEVSWYKVEVL